MPSRKVKRRANRQGEFLAAVNIGPIIIYATRTRPIVLSLTKCVVMAGWMQMKERKNKGEKVENKKSTE